MSPESTLPGPNSTNVVTPSAMAWRTQSFLYAFLIHWFMLVMTVLVATGTFG